MKLKKVLAASAAISLLFSASVSAASIDALTGSVADNVNRTVTISVTYLEAEPDMQATLLVLPENVDLALYEVGNIKYIKQTSAVSSSESGTAKADFSFALAELDREGTYTAYVGGTALDAPAKVNFTFENNTVKVAPTAPDTQNEIVITICGEDGAAAAVEPKLENGVYTFEPDIGAYTVKIGGNAILPYEKHVNTAAGDVDLGSVELISGDVNGDKTISQMDMNEVYEMWASTSAVGGADVNGDGTVSQMDTNIIYSNWAKTSESAYGNVEEFYTETPTEEPVEAPTESTVAISGPVYAASGQTSDGIYSFPQAISGTKTVSFTVVPTVQEQNTLVAINDSSQMTSAQYFANSSVFFLFEGGEIKYRPEAANVNVGENVTYTANEKYHFTVTVNVPNKTFDFVIKNDAGAEIASRTNVAFRNSNVTALDSLVLVNNNYVSNSLYAENLSIAD